MAVSYRNAIARTDTALLRELIEQVKNGSTEVEIPPAPGAWGRASMPLPIPAHIFQQLANTELSRREGYEAPPSGSTVWLVLGGVAILGWLFLKGK